MTTPPILAGTLQTDPRSGGLKRTSGVQIDPEVARAWEEVRDDTNTDIDYVLIGYDGPSKTQLRVLDKGRGGLQTLGTQCFPSEMLATQYNQDGVVFGGVKLIATTNRFVSFLYIDSDLCPAVKKGRTLMVRTAMHANENSNIRSLLEGTVATVFTSYPTHTVFLILFVVVYFYGFD